MSTPCAIIIFAKAPVPGQVKTRLESHLSQEECSKLHSSFILHVIDIARSVESATILLACHPETDHPFFQRITNTYGIQLIRQIGSDLGERITNSIKYALEAGFEKVIVLGSDSPDLPAQYIREGIKALDVKDMVIGPSVDGGYYLIGGKMMLPVFEGIPWSSSDVFKATLEKALRTGVTFSVLPEWYDIDTWDDLQSFLNLNGAKKSLDIGNDNYDYMKFDEK